MYLAQVEDIQGYRKESQYITAYGEECVCIFSVCVLRDSGHGNYPIHLKFGTNIHGLCKICCTDFGAHLCAYGGKFFKIGFDMVILHKI